MAHNTAKDAKNGANTGFQDSMRLILHECVSMMQNGMDAMTLSDFDMGSVRRSRAAAIMHRLGLIERLHPTQWLIRITPLAHTFLRLLDTETLNHIETWQTLPVTSVWALETADPGFNGRPHSLTIKAAPYVVRYLHTQGSDGAAQLAELVGSYPAVAMWARVSILAPLVDAGADVSNASNRTYILMGDEMVRGIESVSAQLGIGEQDIKRAAIAHYLSLIGAL